VFDLNPNYWGAKAGLKPLPKIQRVIYVPGQDDTLTVQQLISNQLDLGNVLPVPTLKRAFAQNQKIITFSGQDPPHGYTDWCPISLGFNDSAAPFDKAEFRQAINFAIDRTKLVNLAEAGAGVLAYHQFTPYAWFQKFDEAIKPTEQKYGLDATAHPDRVAELLGKLGYTRGGDGMWADSTGQKPNMKIAVPDWLKNYGPPLSQQLRDAGFDASFDTSPGLDSQVQTGEQAIYFSCQGPAGVKGMDPTSCCQYSSRSISARRASQRQSRGPRRATETRITTRLSTRSARSASTIPRRSTTSRKRWTSGSRTCRWSMCRS
jgi:peptide/nickel transport system substrate-binding protein